MLNPKQANCSYPDKNLCGAGVAFKLAQALLEKHPERSRRAASLLPSFLKLVCIGTIADSVPLVGENRVIARLGLEGLSRPVNHGLKALIEIAGLDGKDITAWDVGFRLAPRLNAAGRMESAQDVIELFTLADAAGAQQVALKLNRLNSERQKAEQDILAEIEERYRRQPESFSDYFLVAGGQGMAPGCYRHCCQPHHGPISSADAGDFLRGGPQDTAPGVLSRIFPCWRRSLPAAIFLSVSAAMPLQPALPCPWNALRNCAGG